jgi:hypothetical protein
MSPYRILGAIVAAGLVAGLVRASSAPLVVHPSNDGLLRLAWSARPERIQKCRQRSDEELAKLPQHMRQPLACEGTTAEYRLQVRVEGVLVVERIVRGGGLRRDRRLYVFEELPLAAGAERAIDVRLDRVESDAGTPAVPAADSSGPRVDAVPPHLAFERRLRVAPRQVVLITYDREREALVLGGPLQNLTVTAAPRRPWPNTGDTLMAPPVALR